MPTKAATATSGSRRCSTSHRPGVVRITARTIGGTLRQTPTSGRGSGAAGIGGTPDAWKGDADPASAVTASPVRHHRQRPTAGRRTGTVVLAVLAVAGASLCYGAAAVLQAAAVARAAGPGRAGRLGGLARDPRYAGGLALVVGGFLLSLVVVRVLLLFVVLVGRAFCLG